MKVFKQFTFDVAHQLPDWPGLHGHSYTAEVWCQLRPVGPLIKVKVFRGSIGFGVEFDLVDAKAEGRA